MAASIVARVALQHPGFELDVDLQLPDTGVSALFGHSGSGKTTLLRCLAGLERPARAYIEMAGEVWQCTRRKMFVPPHRRAVGYVFQEASLFPHLSVKGNLEYGMRRVRGSPPQVPLEQACELLGIAPLLGRRPEKLSGGERQRVGIARALLSAPRLLLMDEPLAALDAPRKAEILPYLERLHRELKIPVVYVSHSQDEVARLADHLVLLDGGRVLASGPIGSTLARLDLPTAQDPDAGVVIEGIVSAFEPAYQLLTLMLPDGLTTLRIVHEALPVGSRLRVKVQARDVSLSRQPDGKSSILNRLPAFVTGLMPSGQGAHVLVGLDCGSTALTARITRFSAEQLALEPGAPVWAQIKAVAVLA